MLIVYLLSQSSDRLGFRWIYVTVTRKFVRNHISIKLRFPFEWTLFRAHLWDTVLNSVILFLQERSLSLSDLYSSWTSVVSPRRRQGGYVLHIFFIVLLVNNLNLDVHPEWIRYFLKCHTFEGLGRATHRYQQLLRSTTLLVAHWVIIYFNQWLCKLFVLYRLFYHHCIAFIMRAGNSCSRHYGTARSHEAGRLSDLGTC